MMQINTMEKIGATMLMEMLLVFTKYVLIPTEQVNMYHKSFQGISISPRWDLEGCTTTKHHPLMMTPASHVKDMEDN